MNLDLASRAMNSSFYLLAYLPGEGRKPRGGEGRREEGRGTFVQNKKNDWNHQEILSFAKNSTEETRRQLEVVPEFQKPIDLEIPFGSKECHQGDPVPRSAQRPFHCHGDAYMVGCVRVQCFYFGDVYIYIIIHVRVFLRMSLVIGGNHHCRKG